MTIRRSILATAFALAVAITSAAQAGELRPIEGRTINLGEVSGVVYYTVVEREQGLHVVATLAQGDEVCPSASRPSSPRAKASCSPPRAVWAWPPRRSRSAAMTTASSSRPPQSRTDPPKPRPTLPSFPRKREGMYTSLEFGWVPFVYPSPPCGGGCIDRTHGERVFGDMVNTFSWYRKSMREAVGAVGGEVASCCCGASL